MGFVLFVEPAKTECESQITINYSL